MYSQRLNCIHNKCSHNDCFFVWVCVCRLVWVVFSNLISAICWGSPRLKNAHSHLMPAICRHYSIWRAIVKGQFNLDTLPVLTRPSCLHCATLKFKTTKQMIGQKSGEGEAINKRTESSMITINFRGSSQHSTKASEFNCPTTIVFGFI